MGFFKSAKSWAGGIIGSAAAVTFLVIAPVVSVYKGTTEAWKENPEGITNWEQFKDGASFGLYEAGEGITAEGTADKLYDGTRNVIESTEKFGERVIERLGDDFDGASSPDLDSLSSEERTQKLIDDCIQNGGDCFDAAPNDPN